jgi:hypothetical protein
MRSAAILSVLAFACTLHADEAKLHRGLPYARPKNERQTLDAYAAPKAKNQPIVLWIHEGGGHKGDKADAQKLAEQLGKLKKLGARVKLDDQDRVVEVNLGERKVTDADLVLLRGFHHLRELDLTRTKVTGAGLKHLRDLTSLQTLYLTETKVDDAGIGHLKKMKTLSLIGLSGTKITDAAVDHLKEMTGLRQLFCLGTAVTDDGAKKLKRALPKCDVTR